MKSKPGKCNSVTRRHIYGTDKQKACPVHGIHAAPANQQGATDRFVGSPPRGLYCCDEPPPSKEERAELMALHSEAKDASTPPITLDRLARHEDPTVRLLVAQNPSTLYETVKHLVGSDQDRTQRVSIADAVPRAASMLAKSDDRYERHLAASSRSCPAEVLEALAQDEDWSIRASVAKNPSCSQELMKTLAQDDQLLVREAVAANRNCDEEILDTLASDRVFTVRRTVAEYATNPDTIDVLSRDEDSSVRVAVTLNGDVSQSTIAKMCESETEPWVFTETLNSNHAPEWVQEAVWWTLGDDVPPAEQRARWELFVAVSDQASHPGLRIPRHNLEAIERLYDIPGVVERDDSGNRATGINLTKKAVKKALKG